MKKIIILSIVAFFSLSIFALFISADTSITGSSGYFTVPRTSSVATGTVNINTGYIFSPGNFYISANTSFIKNWELSAGKEVLTYENSGGIKYTPFIFGSKYMFYGSGGGFKAALGIQVELINKDVGLPGTPITIYGVISDSAGKLGYMTTGIGYTLGINAGYNINFMFGLKKAIIGNQLFAIGEFTNFSIRQGFGLPWDVNRGIFNAGLLLKLNDFISFKFTAYDLFDNFLTVGLGGELKLKVF